MVKYAPAEVGAGVPITLSPKWLLPVHDVPIVLHLVDSLHSQHVFHCIDKGH